VSGLLISPNRKASAVVRHLPRTSTKLLVGAYDAVLETGHLNREEILAVVEYAVGKRACQSLFGERGRREMILRWCGV
jgi:hypothetical protein